jgi:Mn2+/Fe2+ NRAMP family transporter
VLFAGAAVGVSHIVQSTRVGGTFGTGAVVIVVVSCLVKWQAFRFGPLYTAATGHSLLTGYRSQGRWVLGLYALLTAAILFTTLAAVTVVTAGLLLNLVAIGPSLEALGVGPAYHATTVSGMLFLLTGFILWRGGYAWLDRLMKVVMPVLIVATFAATAIALSRFSAADVTFFPAIDTSSSVGLTAATIGWMPAPIDIAVWSSLWALARARTKRLKPSMKGVLRDFDIGYTVTLVLGICFVVLGAAIMFKEDIAFKTGAAGFAGQVVDLYTANLGDWSWPIIATAAFLAMFSTTIACVDGFPRAVAALFAEAFGDRTDSTEGSRSAYWWTFLGGSIGAMLILIFTLGREGVSFTSLVDFVTVTSFIAAPVLAFFNHRAVHSSDVPREFRPSRFVTAWSWVGIALMASFALAYIIFRVSLLGQA